jgi:crossover junction endodeoxyribonuclease RuvC
MTGTKWERDGDSRNSHPGLGGFTAVVHRRVGHISHLVSGRENAIDRPMGAHAIRILGIDPGLRRTGWGVVDVEGNRLIFVACGAIETDDKAALAVRLVTIHDGLARVVGEFCPNEAAAEATFVNKDAGATLKLGQARGVALLAAAQAGMPVTEYAPNLVKKTIVGAGHAEKAQIRMMIGVLLPKADPRSEDAADALAIAVTHAHHRVSAVLKLAGRGVPA